MLQARQWQQSESNKPAVLNVVFADHRIADVEPYVPRSRSSSSYRHLSTWQTNLCVVRRLFHVDAFKHFGIAGH